ncbi:Uncharacterised protein [Vibrio cholerae]|uniref:hypothetical protein n=1 Tax=Vibrio TaxID=662 RepID=UPI00066437ED|nr:MULTISPECIES: hypothetical protein [Vibrio]ELG2042945.1 hypothetical protein [Vibrio fluvialis]ELL4669147.1 hypothetical protein [Vibrio fluvialis]MBY7899156.1 hypothetical protein [Vibrio fluvialis]MBY7962048.1 hypothetical protein [Vibrio fluvialis]MBY8077926.1 hypothetical protein [Vibrio fluvialis]
MASQRFSLSGSTLKEVKVLAKAGGMTEAELVVRLVEVGLGRIELRINQKTIDESKAYG